MSELKIDQRPDNDETVIEGTRYSNALLRTLGQQGVGHGPFVIESRGDGVVVLTHLYPVAWVRGVVSHVPGEPDEHYHEFYGGDAPPDDSKDWKPLYKAPKRLSLASREAQDHGT